MYRTHTCGELTKNEVGANVTLAGWVHKRRDFGGLIFVDLRDRYGLTQVVFRPEEVEDMEAAEHLKYEYVINVEGTVVAREPNTVNKELATGEIEVAAKRVEILSKAKTLPFEIFDAGKGEEDEELRLKYRFLELRREKLKNNILFRAKMVKHIREFMEARVCGYCDADFDRVVARGRAIFSCRRDCTGKFMPAARRRTVQAAPHGGWI